MDFGRENLNKVLSWSEKQFCDDVENDKSPDWLFSIFMLKWYEHLNLLFAKGLFNTMQSALPVSNYYQYFRIFGSSSFIVMYFNKNYHSKIICFVTGCVYINTLVVFLPNETPHRKSYSYIEELHKLEILSISICCIRFLLLFKILARYPT